MKSISLILVAALCGAGPLLADEAIKPTVSETQVTVDQKIGKEAIAQIRKGYEEGRYDEFLKEMDGSYESLVENNKLSGLSSLRQGVNSDPKWIESAQKLQKERNKALLDAVDGEETLFAEKVRSAASDLANEEAIQRLIEFRQMAPGEGKSSEENKLIDLDLEYEYKSIHLDMPSVGGEVLSDGREKHYVLKMNHMDKMLAASQGFEDAELKKQIELAAQIQDARMAQNWDQSDLSALAKGRVEAKDAMEKKVASYLQSHQERLGDLTKQMLDAEKQDAAKN